MTVLKRVTRLNLLIALLLIFLTALLLFTIFFKTHFYPGTEINGVKISCLTTREADRKLNDAVSSYVLELIERDDVRELIKGSEIGLKFDTLYGSAFYKRKQNRTFWIFSFLENDALKFHDAYGCNENLLKIRYKKLSCADKEKIIEPKNAALVYINGSYQIVNEVYGNQVKDELVYAIIKGAVKNGKSSVALEKMNCYIDPAIKSDSQRVMNAKKTAESYLTSKVIYQYPGGSETVDENDIGSWIEFDNQLNLSFNIAKVMSFLTQLADHYNTCGKERDFITSSGEKIKIGGGDYGWKVDIKKETMALIENVISGRTVVREPQYSQKGALRDINDIGLTYVEINLSKQHLWFYRDGKLVVSGALVSGNVNKGHKTPEGIYRLKYKIRNAVLKGENYRTNVSYWMPFNNDIGIHDAPWRTEFGRNIYLTRGSHGCINVSSWLARTIFDNIAAGTPIVCYY